ncbi:AbrB family transcriptional regulator [Cumulibacter manganitolerans]|uniref:AbrB family transcriptional regulator n=1 Tax=Cumulibacter manganitolerans TaxID=1884992 RepID=UPI001295264D|nr:AbrB family transcriptional regulator [Cumulibacter manganitolerans]
MTSDRRGYLATRRTRRVAGDRRLTRRTVLPWAVAVVAGAVAGWLLAVLGVPSPTLFAGLVGGCIVALWLENPPQIGRLTTRASQAVIGTTIGATITLPALQRLATGWAAAVAVTAATLALSIGCGFLLSRIGRIGRLTGVLSMIAGGASTLTAITRELGGDDRVVAVVQYLRVLLILVTLPAIALWFFHAHAGPTTSAPHTRLWSDLLYTALCVGIGALIGWLIPISTFFLLGPMIVSAVLAISGVLGAVRVPEPVVAVCFVALGLQVGLRFTRASLRAIARLLPAAAVMILLVVIGSGALGWVLEQATGIDPLTAYLATTPGGLPAVLAIATDSNADATYVFAVQMARLLLVLITAPLLSRLIGRERSTD